jgi:uncharacterized protein YggE
MEPTFDYKKFTYIAGTLALIGVFFASIAVASSQWHGINHPNGQTSSITVTGDGEVTAIPDIATVNFTVRESAKTVPEAQKLAEAKIQAATKALSTLGIDKKDIRTISYYVNPKYESYAATTGMYPVYNQRITGYEVTESIEVKVRKTDSAGDAIGALGAANITEISGPSFTVEDMDKVQADAKEKAIAEAKDKAKATARSLGMDLGDVLQFSEDNGGGYYPMYARDVTSNQALGKGASTPEVSLPMGENTIKSHVTITYSLE